MLKSRRKKNEETKRRFEAIKDLMSTFAMASVAVVAAVTLIPASPKAEVIKAVALNQEIVYQVMVTDEDNALDLSTLFVVLENQLEFYEQHISLGETSGYFDSLKYNTKYRLSVYGDKGFGKERLDSVIITTKDRVGGTILSVTTDIIDFSSTYFIDVSINDPNSKYSSIDLYYGYSSDIDAEIQYSSIPVTSSRKKIELLNIFTSNEIHIYLEGTTIDGKVLLDEIWVTPPFKLYTSLYVEFVNNKQIGFFIYTDEDGNEISYEMNIYKNSSKIRKDILIFEPSGFHGSEFIIDNLSQNTTYLLECVAKYINPITLRQENAIVYQEEITTLEDYNYTYSLESFNDYYEVTLELIDPSHYFQNAFYETYDTSGEESIYINGEIYPFVANIDNKSVTFTIPNPPSDSYKITIGIRNEFDFSIRQIIDNIIFE